MSTCCICGVSFEARHDYGLCTLCFSKSTLHEYDRLASTTHRASKNGIEASLTLLQWLSAVSDWKGLCSFCEEYTYSVIERYDTTKPLTYDNAVPCCRACSKRRREGYDTAERKVKVYLESDVEAKPIAQDKDEAMSHVEYH